MCETIRYRPTDQTLGSAERSQLLNELGGLKGDLNDLHNQAARGPIGPAFLRNLGATLNRLNAALRAADIDPDEAVRLADERDARISRGADLELEYVRHSA